MTNLNKLIHTGSIQTKKGKRYLFLREVEPHHYIWFLEEEPGKEMDTGVSAASIEFALQLARKTWKMDNFRTVICGFRYTLPERDEHGANALFHEMAASYASSNGVYFDHDLGHNCVVYHASKEARQLLHRLLASSSL